MVFDNGNLCLRLFNQEGEHCLSILPCADDEKGNVSCWDLAKPDGKVLWCGVDNELVELLSEQMGGFNEIEKKPIRCHRCDELMKDGHYDCAFI